MADNKEKSSTNIKVAELAKDVKYTNDELDRLNGQMEELVELLSYLKDESLAKKVEYDLRIDNLEGKDKELKEEIEKEVDGLEKKISDLDKKPEKTEKNGNGFLSYNLKTIIFFAFLLFLGLGVIIGTIIVILGKVIGWF